MNHFLGSSLFPFLLMLVIWGVRVGDPVSAVSCGTWNVISSPNRASLNNTLTGVTTISGRDAWAVGDSSDNNGMVQTLTEHWNGTKWSIVQSANRALSSNELSGVTAISTNNVWMVGDSNNSSQVRQTLIEHWNGTKWSIVASPNPPSNTSYFTGITAISANDVWAVGDFINSNNVQQTLIEHWNGTRWSIVKSVNPGVNDNYLGGIAAIATNDVWAVGSFIDSSKVRKTLAEHWDGRQWSTVKTLNPGSSSNNFNGVIAISANDVWSVGDSINNNRMRQTLIEHWNGTKWSIVPSPNPSSMTNFLIGGAASSTKDVWAVGFFTKNNVQQTLTEHWNGMKWSVIQSPNPGSVDDSLYGAARVPGTSQVWTVGSFVNNGNGGQTLVEFYC